MGLLIADATGRILYANEAAERLLGLSDADRERWFLERLCPALASYQELLSSPVLPKPFETTCTTMAEQSVDVLLGVALLNPDAPLGERQLAAFIADLTLQKKSEEMLRRTEKLAVAGRLAASIAHEINNPLEAVTNLLYLLDRCTLDEEARTYLTLAQSELNRVAQITVQTLRFHRQSTRPSPTDLPELLSSVLALLETRIRRLGAAVVTRYRPVPKIVLHDGEIRQVVANLIGNALDALPPGGKVVLRAGTMAHPVSGAPGVVLTVADTGSGMSAETRAHVFEPFFSTKGITGTGLGLWISQEIVTKHGGNMRVWSRQATAGQSSGTVFRLFLPFLSGELNPPA